MDDTDDTGQSVDDTAPIDTLGYPREEFVALQGQSETLYEQNVERFGDGKNWLADEPRWHIWKACDELFQMRDHAHGDVDYDNALRAAGDALNHMLFALEIARDRRSVESDTGEEDADR